MLAAEFGNGIITCSHQWFLAGSSKPLAKDDELLEADDDSVFALLMTGATGTFAIGD